MNVIERTIGTAVVFTALASGSMAAPPEGIDQTLADVAAWTDDQSREPVNRLEAIVRAAETTPAASRECERAMAGFLSSTNGTPAARQAVARLLGRIASDESVPALAELMKDPASADIARLALEPIPGRRADEALAGALAHSDPRVRMGALGSLGHRRSEPSIGAIARLLVASDPAVASAAADALGHIASTEAAQYLESAMPTQTGAVRQAMAEAMLRHADRLMRERKPRRAGIVYSRFESAEWPASVRLAAFTGHVRASGANASDLIIAAASGEDPALRTAALSLVRTLGEERQVAHVAAALPRLAPADQIALMAALGDREAPAAAAPVMMVATGSAPPEVRIVALRALASLREASAVPLLAGVAAFETGAPRTAARDSLARLSAPGVDEALPVLLGATPQPEVRVELLRAMAARETPGDCAPILRAVEEGPQAVREAGLKALARLAAPGDLARLLALAARLPPETGRDEIAGMLEAVARRTPGRPDPGAFTAQYGPDTPPALKLVILSVLGRLGGAAPLETVRAAMRESDATVRQAAVRALSEWPDASALNDLIALAAVEQSADARSRALRGYIRLVLADRNRAEAETVALHRRAWSLAKSDERRMILAGLGDLKGPEALAMAADALDDSAVKAEAAAAVLRLAQAAASAHPAAARQALDRVAQAIEDPKVKAEAEALRGKLPGGS